MRMAGPRLVRLDASERLRLRPLPTRRPLGIDVERVEGLARGHEQAVALEAAEADVGAVLRQRDAPDPGAVRLGANRSSR